jgi:hypothetical protein
METDSERPERRRTITLSEQQVDAIIGRAVQRAIDASIDRIYLNLGKALLRTILYMVGTTLVGAFLWIKTLGKS